MSINKNSEKESWFRMSEWIDNKIKIPIYQYNLRDKSTIVTSKQKVLAFLAKEFVYTDAQLWLMGIFLKACGRVFLAKLLGDKTETHLWKDFQFFFLGKRNKKE